MLHPLRMAAPDVDFIAANEAASCRYMKMITLPKLRDALRDGEPVVKVPDGDRRARPRCRSSAWSRSAERRRALLLAAPTSSTDTAPGPRRCG